LSVTCPSCGRVNRPGARYCASCQTPLSTIAAPLQPGQLLDGGSYRVVRPLGKGGMGAVWLVAQTKAFDRLAVLKEVIDYFDPADVGERQKALQRFEAEARTLGDLKHPGIPDLYAYFSEGGHNYLVMEYIEGPDLRQGLTREDSDTGQLIPGGPTPAEHVLHYTIEICKVLEYLAGRRPPVVHNDIKPGNIIIDEHSGRAVLVDFGTAKTRYLHATGRPDGDKASLYGTVGYAAPELYRGQSEPRSDVYSLAATAYHLLTDDDPRDHPFKYPQLGALPPALTGILRTALAEEIDQRLMATQFRQQLEGYLGGQNAPLRALTFPDGDAADSRNSLLTLAVRHWRYAASILQDGTMARWLRGTLHDPAAAMAADSAVKRWPGNADAALDAFIRELDPSVQPPGVLQLRTTGLHLPQAGAGQRIPQQIEIANLGKGYLRGEVLSSREWLKVGNGAFGCPPGTATRLPIEIDTTGLAPDQSYLAAVTLMPDGGTPDVLPVQITVTAPAIRVEPTAVDLGRVSRGDVSTPRRNVTVTNVSRAGAQCRVQGAPAWLLVKPDRFGLQPNAQQNVELVGRVAKVPGGRQRVTLTIALDGGQDQRVEVKLHVRSGFFG
jgi:tRNA A-37 threonylcarbamoyl transferase component Bud32